DRRGNYKACSKNGTRAGGRPALGDTSGGDRAVALPDGRGIGPCGRRRAAEPSGGSAESRVASGRYGVPSSPVSSAAADSLERQCRSAWEARPRPALSPPRPDAARLGEITWRGLKQALHAVSFLQVPQEVFLS